MKSHDDNTCIDNLWQAVNSLGDRLGNLEVNLGRSYLRTCTYADELNDRLAYLEGIAGTRGHSHFSIVSARGRHLTRLQDLYDRSIHSSADRDALRYAIMRLTQT